MRDAALELNAQNKIVRRELGLRFLNRAERLGGASPDLLVRKAKALFALQRVNGAIEATFEAIKIDPSFLGAYKWCGFLHITASKFREAIDVLEKARGLDPRDVEILEYLATAYEKMGDFDKANECWRETSLIQPSSVRPWLQQALYHSTQGDYVTARENYQKAYNLDSSVALPWKTRSGEADSAYASGQIAEADQAYAVALQWHSSYLPALLGRSRCSISRGDMQQALAFLKSAIELNAHSSEAHLLAGNVSHSLQDDESARKYWLRAFHLDPSVAVPWAVEMRTAKTFFLDGNFQEAIEHLEEAKRLNPDWVEVDKRLHEVNERLRAISMAAEGDDHAAKGNFLEAERAWLQALKHHESPEILLKIGAEYADRGNTGEALEYFERASRLGHPLAESALSLCRSYHDFRPEVGPS